jgi:hypothetical protein
VEVAHRVLEHIESDGSISHLAVPVSALDPSGIRFWAERVVKDADLAEAIASARGGLADLLVARRTQAEEVAGASGR